ncbi:MAG TPA: hypothetical protein VME43_32900 [Bryobacteraceae bacterium]|nr:hypothetical protein [Bryobacteraceae bacterium]
MRAILLLCLIGIGAPSAAAQVCGRYDVRGAYGIQLYGTTTIGANGTQPMAGIGRVYFGDDGGVTAVTSVNLDGYFLGNPVTGTYTFNNHCALTFDVRDQSGGTEHFRGTATEGGQTVEIRQTDPETGERGVLERTPATCRNASFQGVFTFSLSGTASQFDTEEAPGSAFSIEGTVTADGAGNLVFASAAGKTTGTYQLDSDCVAEIELGILKGDSAGILKLRGVLVKQGKLLLAAESDPARIATARFTAKQ